MKKITTASITAVAVLAVLAGCSGAPDDTKQSDEPEPTSSSTPSAAAANNTCEDGTLTVTDAASAKQALEKGCDTVYLLTSEQKLDLGAVKNLGIEGNGNTVSVDSVETVYVMGKDNTVTHGGETPDTKGVAKGNTVTAAK